MKSESPAHKRPYRKRRVSRIKMSRIMLSIPGQLLKQVDEAAEQDFTTRSDIIRTALRWYLRPEKREFADAEEIFQTIKRRKAIAGMNKIMQDVGLIKPRKKK